MGYNDDELMEEKSFKTNDGFGDDLDDLNEPLDETTEDFGLKEEELE